MNHAVINMKWIKHKLHAHETDTSKMVMDLFAVCEVC